jgi:hypothetical protein
MPYTRAARGADAAARQFPRDAGCDADPATDATIALRQAHRVAVYIAAGELAAC